MDLQLTGKCALVTGSSSGIGQSTAETLGREGVTVVVHGRNQERLDAVVSNIRQAGGEAQAVVADMSNSSEVEQLAEEALELTGGIDILVNNAGGRARTNSNDLFEVSAEDWLDTYALNVASSLTLSQRLAVGMKERQWGRIINISSAAGSFIRRQAPPDYAASKAALNSLTLSLANALRETGVSVATVSPGPVLTPSLEGFIRRVICKDNPELDFAEAERKAARDYFNVPLGRLGRPEEIAAIIAVLVSPLGGFCHGTNVHIDGGSIGVVN
jgi:3-oxoacyl-[acyl-carrier protein] reductase